MLILNLGCGTKTSNFCINIDWSIYLKLKQNFILRAIALPFAGKIRRERLNMVNENILVHNLRKPLPFSDCVVDAVYHSHVLEHIDREIVQSFINETYRVLKPNGILRFSVPDWERLCREYLQDVQDCENGTATLNEHESYIVAMIEQCVRKEAYGSSQRGPLMRLMEKFLLGDARARGETHQWMYDRFSLICLLKNAGFREINARIWNDSAIPGWKAIGLEADEIGHEYKPGSLYMECCK